MMNNIIHKNIVLVLNKNWQAIAITTPAGAYAQMATDAATGLDVHSEEWMMPLGGGIGTISLSERKIFLLV